MKKRPRFCRKDGRRAGLAAMFLLCAAAAYTQQWQIGMHANHLTGGSLKRNEDVGWGAQLVYRFTDIYSAELGLSRYAALSKDRTAELDITAALLTARVHFSPLTRYAALYGGLGAGCYAEDVERADPPATEDDTVRIRPHAMLGGQVFLGERWSLFADYRYTFVHVLHQDNFNHGLLRIGLNYDF